MEVDHYIDWGLARDQLIEAHQELMDALRICDIALANNQPTGPSGDLIWGKMVQILRLEDEQIQQLSQAYTAQVAAIYRAVKSLGEGEINHDPEENRTAQG